jgi:hypothetical protein
VAETPAALAFQLTRHSPSPKGARRAAGRSPAVGNPRRHPHRRADRRASSRGRVHHLCGDSARDKPFGTAIVGPLPIAVYWCCAFAVGLSLHQEPVANDEPARSPLPSWAAPS